MDSTPRLNAPTALTTEAIAVPNDVAEWNISAGHSLDVLVR